MVWQAAGRKLLLGGVPRWPSSDFTPSPSVPSVGSTSTGGKEPTCRGHHTSTVWVWGKKGENIMIPLSQIGFGGWRNVSWAQEGKGQLCALILGARRDGIYLRDVGRRCEVSARMDQHQDAFQTQGRGRDPAVGYARVGKDI